MLHSEISMYDCLPPRSVLQRNETDAGGESGEQ